MTYSTSLFFLERGEKREKRWFKKIKEARENSSFKNFKAGIEITVVFFHVYTISLVRILWAEIGVEKYSRVENWLESSYLAAFKTVELDWFDCRWMYALNKM